MKFLVDMPLSYKLAEFLRNKRHDAFHLSERNLQRASDEQVFNLAIKEQRIIITADLDFSRIFALSVSTHHSLPGLILFREGNLSDKQMIEYIQRVIDTVPSDKINKSIIVVEPDRIRINPLI